MYYGAFRYDNQRRRIVHLSKLSDEQVTNLVVADSRYKAHLDSETTVIESIARNHGILGKPGWSGSGWSVSGRHLLKYDVGRRERYDTLQGAILLEPYEQAAVEEAETRAADSYQAVLCLEKEIIGEHLKEHNLSDPLFRAMIDGNYVVVYEDLRNEGTV